MSLLTRRTHLLQLNDSVYQFCKPQGRPSTEIVLFHGLNLDGSEEAYWRTWLSADGSELWPQWILEVIPEARILSISYDASMRKTNKKGLMDTYRICENLIQDLAEARVGEDGCPVILVGHSVGCLIMKELCTQLSKTLPQNPDDSVKNLFHNLKGLFYYACPHHGSKFADSSTEYLKGPLFEDLTTLNKEAERRNEDFRKLRREYGWRTFGIGEGRPTTFEHFTGFIVPEGSGRHDVDGFYTAGFDHFDVCQPHSMKSSRFLPLLKFISDVLEKDKERHSPQIHIPDGTVGLVRRVKALMEMLDKRKRLGIVGIGGIGKTTLATALYENIQSSFEYSCFLTDVKTFMTSKENPKLLRDKILENLSHKGRETDQSFKWDMLKGKKVLIALDDVEYRSQIKVMMGSDGFSDASRVIVTSRGSEVLERENFTCYIVELLDSEESEELFCLNTFRGDSMPDHQKPRVMKFVLKCGGLPLALGVMSRYLKGERDENVWDEVLKRLNEAHPPNGSREDELWSLLRVSYNNLQEEEQQMFLDVATCFHGEDLDSVTQAWTVCGWASPLLRLKNLVEKCLVTIEKQIAWRSERSVIRMHEVLRALGRNIAGHSRVCYDRSNPLPWRFDEGMMKAGPETKILKINENQTESVPRVQCINIQEIDGSEVQSISIQELHGLEELKILWLDEVSLHGPCNLLPADLAFMRINGRMWDSGLYNPAEGSRLPKLRHMEVRQLTIFKDVRNSLGELQALEYLQIDSQAWEVLPESLGQLIALKHLLIRDCKKLRAIPDTIRHLPKLEHLRIFGKCRCFSDPPQSLGNLQALQHFEIPWCHDWQALLDIFGQLQSLRKFVFQSCMNHGCPGAIGQLNFLESLTQTSRRKTGRCTTILEESIQISGWKQASLPNWVGRLGHATRLVISDCTSLRGLPDALGDLHSLKFFYLKSCESLESLPDSLGLLMALQDFRIQECKRLKALPNTLGDLQSLEIFGIESCESLKSLPETLGSLKALEKLRVCDCGNLATLPDSFGKLRALRRLEITKCKVVRALPHTLGGLESLRWFSLESCESLESLPDSFGLLKALDSSELRSAKD